MNQMLILMPVFIFLIYGCLRTKMSKNAAIIVVLSILVNSFNRMFCRKWSPQYIVK